MKYIITESQYNIITENSKRIDAFQKLIDRELKQFQDMCEEEGDDDFDFCNQIGSAEHITIDDIEQIKSESSPLLIIKINIYYNFMRYSDYSDLIYQLKHSLTKSTGLPIDIQYETINLISNPQW